MNNVENFGAYVNALFFNVFSETPDSQVSMFLKSHVPVDMKPSYAEGMWTAYPDTFSAFTEMSHSYFFSDHPVIKAPFRRGEFRVYTQVFTDPEFPNRVSICDVALLLSFDDPDQAVPLFEKIRADLRAFGSEEQLNENRLYKMAVFFGQGSYGIQPGKVRVCLVERSIFDLEKHQLIIDMFGY